MPAKRMAVLERLTIKVVVIISDSMLDRVCSRVEFLRAFAYLNTMSERKIRPRVGGKAPAASTQYPGERSILS